MGGGVMDIGQDQKRHSGRSSEIGKEIHAMGGMQQNGPTQDVQTSVFITGRPSGFSSARPTVGMAMEERISLVRARFLFARTYNDNVVAVD